MKIKVAKDRCVGHARCNAIAPELLTLDDQGYSNVDCKEVPDELQELARRAEKACPERIISIIED